MFGRVDTVLIEQPRRTVRHATFSVCFATAFRSSGVSVYDTDAEARLHAAQKRFSLPCGQGLQSAHLRFNLPCGQGLHVTQSFFLLSCQHLSPHAMVVARSPPLAHPTLWSVPAARDEMRRDVRRFVSPSKRRRSARLQFWQFSNLQTDFSVRCALGQSRVAISD